MTKENSKTVEMLPFEVIAAATQGDTDALCKVLEHYDGYIAKLSTRIARDEYGNSFTTPTLTTVFRAGVLTAPIFSVCSPILTQEM